MLERDVERHFVDEVKAAGGVARKYRSPGHMHDPDRLVLWPGGRAQFVELKKPGEKPRPGQLREHERLRKLGFTVDVIDNKADATAWVQQNAPQLEDVMA